MKKDKQGNKKIKLWEKILIVFMIFFIILAIIVGIRYSTLSKIYKNYEQSKSSTNYYWRSESNDAVIEYWRKDAIRKINVKRAGDEGGFVIWRDDINKNSYMIYAQTQRYAINKAKDLLNTFPISMLGNGTTMEKFVIAMTPSISISSRKDGDKTYCILSKADSVNVIEKDTGLIIYGEEGSRFRKIEYSFGTVTDEDVEMPDVSGYTYIDD